MSVQKIKLNYEQADKMAKTFKQGAQQIQQTMQEMQSIAQTLEEGALLGRGGKEFAEAIKGKLCPSLKKLSAKYTELERDVHAAIKSMREADSESKQQFT